jgi:hypothetical protein
MPEAVRERVPFYVLRIDSQSSAMEWSSSLLTRLTPRV